MECPEQFLSQKKGSWMFNCPSFGSTSNVLTPDKKPMEQDQTFKKPEHPAFPSAVWSGCWPPFPLGSSFGLNKVFLVQAKYFPSFRHTPYKVYFTSGTGLERGTVSRTENVDFKPFTISRKAQQDSVSRSPQSLVNTAVFTQGKGGGRHATCMHSKLKQQMNDNGQLTQVKRV